MKKILLFFVFFSSFYFVKAQNIDAKTALQIVEKNSAGIGLSKEQAKEVLISSAYYDKQASTQMVYVQQSL